MTNLSLSLIPSFSLLKQSWKSPTAWISDFESDAVLNIVTESRSLVQQWKRCLLNSSVSLNQTWKKKNNWAQTLLFKHVDAFSPIMQMCSRRYCADTNYFPRIRNENVYRLFDSDSTLFQLFINSSAPAISNHSPCPSPGVALDGWWLEEKSRQFSAEGAGRIECILEGLIKDPLA